MERTIHISLEEKYRWNIWAAPKKDGKINLLNAQSGDDLLEFVNKELFPYLKSFKSISKIQSLSNIK